MADTPGGGSTSARQQAWEESTPLRITRVRRALRLRALLVAGLGATQLLRPRSYSFSRIMKRTRRFCLRASLSSFLLMRFGSIFTAGWSSP